MVTGYRSQISIQPKLFIKNNGKFFIIACEIDEFIELLEREGYTEQAKCVRLQMEEVIKNTGFDNINKGLHISDVISNFEGMRLLNKEEIKINKKVYIKGDDGRSYLLTIVSDDFYRDEDTELSETEAYYYQEKGELYVAEQ